jgi:hypothetical protein
MMAEGPAIVFVKHCVQRHVIASAFLALAATGNPQSVPPRINGIDGCAG